MTSVGGLRHAGSVAIVTGAASGIGQATAARLVDEGASVVACDTNQDGLDSLVHSLAAQDAQLRAVPADVTSQDDVDRVVRTAESLGGANLLANVAGIMDGFLAAHELDDDTWTRVMAVNVDAVFRLSRAVLPGMLGQGGGAIVNIGSVAGTRGGAAGAAYTTSKHALVGLTRSLAWTYATDRIRCNIVMPGYVKTGIASSGTPRGQWGLERVQPVLAQSVRRSDADEIAAVVSWLLSAEAGAVNGAVLSADGGWTAG